MPEDKFSEGYAYYFFQASIRNCKNCVHNEDHSLFDSYIRDSMYNIIRINVQYNSYIISSFIHSSRAQ